jgi:hypothetical protein
MTRRPTARRAEWHWMLTATGFIVMWVAATSTWTRNEVARPPNPCGPMPSSLTASLSSVSILAPSGSGQVVPSGRVAAIFARCMHRSEVPPTPTPTIVGGQTRPPHSITRSMTKRLIAAAPSAGISICRNEPFSEPEPLGIISIATVSSRASKSTLMIGMRTPHEVCSFLRVIGCTTEERNGCSRVARSQPRRIAACNATPSNATLRPMVTL